MARPKPVALIILDGFGLRGDVQGNAVAQAKKPNYDRYWNQFPHTTLTACGEAVGLPEGQMGNSEVGHLNIGAGRIVYQDLTRISKSIRDGEFYDNETILARFVTPSRTARSCIFTACSPTAACIAISHTCSLCSKPARKSSWTMCTFMRFWTAAT